MKSLASKLAPEDKALVEKVLTAGTIMYKYAIRLQTVLRRANRKSVAEVAEGVLLGKSTVNTILRERGIKPHLEKEFRFSTDRHFEDKLTDVVGLYMNPTDKAIVLCVARTRSRRYRRWSGASHCCRSQTVTLALPAESLGQTVPCYIKDTYRSNHPKDTT
jgi:hypothetical protein